VLLIRTMIQLREWLEPPNFGNELDSATRMREEGTAEWLFSEPKYLTWRGRVVPSSNRRDHVLWVHGKLRSNEAIVHFD
jgi:hypothetical protein